MPVKPLGRKAYGSIPHLIGSRMGPKDHHIHEGQARICCVKTRDRHDRVIITEKLDGSNTSVAKIDGKIIALGRAGWPASTSPYEQHQLFAAWVREVESIFSPLPEGIHIVGEWLAQAHGTRYAHVIRPWAPFDVMEGVNRWSFDKALELLDDIGLIGPSVIWDGAALSVESVMRKLLPNGCEFAHPEDGPEGAVWRVERRGAFDFMAKYVRPDKVDGKYLPEVSGNAPIWNWRPVKKLTEVYG